MESTLELPSGEELEEIVEQAAKDAQDWYGIESY